MNAEINVFLSHALFLYIAILCSPSTISLLLWVNNTENRNQDAKHFTYLRYTHCCTRILKMYDIEAVFIQENLLNYAHLWEASCRNNCRDSCQFKRRVPWQAENVVSNKKKWEASPIRKDLYIIKKKSEVVSKLKMCLDKRKRWGQIKWWSRGLFLTVITYRSQKCERRITPEYLSGSICWRNTNQYKSCHSLSNNNFS